MGKYNFRVYYDFLGPTDNDPLGLHQRSEEDIRFELNNFPEDIRRCWSNDLVHISTSPYSDAPYSILLVIETSESSIEVMNKLENCLKGSVLFAKLIDSE